MATEPQAVCCTAQVFAHCRKVGGARVKIALPPTCLVRRGHTRLGCAVTAVTSEYLARTLRRNITTARID